MNPLLILIITLILISPSTPAALPEPDNLLYGVVSLNNQPITAARTDVIVEARRTLNGPAISRYRMGSEARAGSFYSLRIATEAFGPVGNPSAAQSGENLFIVVTTGGASVLTSRQQVIGERGAVQRLDLGTANPDSDGDLLPDAWELFYFGNLNANSTTLNSNGLRAYQNYQAGYNPNASNTLFHIQTQLSGNQVLVSFLARRASGIGYENANRYYSLQSAPGVTGPWTGVPAYTNLLANDQVITYQTTSTNAPTFFRGQAWVP